VATGTYDEDVKLIKIEPNQELACTATETWKTVHRKLGHAGNKLMKNTMKASTGITISENKFAAIECEDCLTTKAKRGAISKGSTLKKKEIAEVIEIDVQGPFPTVANDGTHSNLKLIDSQSGWLYFSTIPNTRSNTMLEHFMRYKTKLERQTGKKIKRVRTDSGNEFMGEFLTYLELSGIIKEKGVAYTHHHPGKVERAHQTILKLARSMLKDSLLPPKFYNEAQRCASYLFNIMPHGKDTKLPYEYIFGEKPNLKNLMPFGTVCYSYEPPEKEQNWKIVDPNADC